MKFRPCVLKARDAECAECARVAGNQPQEEMVLIVIAGLVFCLPLLDRDQGLDNVPGPGIRAWA